MFFFPYVLYLWGRCQYKECTSWCGCPPPPSCYWGTLSRRSCGPPQNYLEKQFTAHEYQVQACHAQEHTVPVTPSALFKVLKVTFTNRCSPDFTWAATKGAAFMFGALSEPIILYHSTIKLHSCLIVRSLSTLLKVLPTGWFLGMPKICNAHENLV